MNIREDDVVLCTVKRIEGTTVFLDIEGEGSGSMVLSEVAAGRIRNLRDYVSPNKKIVCKVLKVTEDHIELSLRRVTAREKKQVLDRSKKERALKSMLKSVGANAGEVLDKIKIDYDIVDFLEEGSKDKKIFEKYVGVEKASKLSQIVSEKVEKEKVVSGKITLSTESDSGVSDIKDVLNVKDVDIKYVGSSVFSVSVSGRDFREANNKLSEVFKELEKRAKKKHAVIEIVKEK